MYPQILSLLSPKTPDPVRMHALWILGTAVQNNPKAQADVTPYYLMHDFHELTPFFLFYG